VGALGVGEEFGGLGEETYTVEFGHALVGEEEGDGVVAGFEAVESVEGFVGGGGAKNTVAFRITAAKIAFDGLKDIGVVVNGENDWLGHNRSPFKALGRNKI
jgi:hypothetical protein